MVATERQDFAYRPAHSGAAPPPAAVQPAPVPSADLRWEIDTGAALLFRYSALTFNAHRIHYDHDHARTVEGYADILVHGPLQATWLLNAAARLLGRAPVEFRYRALAPLSAPLGAIVTASLGPDGATGLVHDGTGRPTMEGHAR
jgi:3-methylfumaryl-CoA hydratase